MDILNGLAIGVGIVFIAYLASRVFVFVEEREYERRHYRR